MWVGSLGGENPLELEISTCPSILARKFHGQRSLAGYSPRGHKESDRTERLSAHTCIVSEETMGSQGKSANMLLWKTLYDGVLVCWAGIMKYHSYECMHANSLQLVQFFVTSWTIAH